jgi:hypothetical protein
MVAAKIANLAHSVRSDRAANLPLLGEFQAPVKQAEAHSSSAALASVIYRDRSAMHTNRKKAEGSFLQKQRWP